MLSTSKYRLRKFPLCDIIKWVKRIFKPVEKISSEIPYMLREKRFAYEYIRLAALRSNLD